MFLLLPYLRYYFLFVGFMRDSKAEPHVVQAPVWSGIGLEDGEGSVLNKMFLKVSSTSFKISPTKEVH